jgi:hypothetical protein
MPNKPLYKYALFLMVLLSVVLGGYHYYDQNFSSISINPNRPLQWRDFKMVKVINNRPSINARCITYITPTIKNVQQKDGFAKIITDLDVGIDEDLTQVSGAFMSRADPATKQVVLNHENGHFKIAQIIGHRILNQADNHRFHPTAYQEQFDSLVRAQFIAWREMDRQYDLETTSPRDPVKQGEWDLFFKSELKKKDR